MTKKGDRKKQMANNTRNRYSIEKQENQEIPMTPEHYLTNDPHFEIYVNSNFRPHKGESVCHSNLNRIIKLKYIFAVGN